MSSHSTGPGSEPAQPAFLRGRISFAERERGRRIELAPAIQAIA
jgi:hypothetical protein